MRRDAREAVFVLLYRDLFMEEKDASFINSVYNDKKLSATDKEFADRLYASICEHKEQLLSVMSELSKGFLLNRIFSTDKCALLIGLCELTYFQDVPKIVAIDEAVSLSRKFSSEKSQNYVNGVLAAYKQWLENE